MLAFERSGLTEKEFWGVIEMFAVFIILVVIHLPKLIEPET